MSATIPIAAMAVMTLLGGLSPGRAGSQAMGVGPQGRGDATLERPRLLLTEQPTRIQALVEEVAAIEAASRESVEHRTLTTMDSSELWRRMKVRGRTDAIARERNINPALMDTLLFQSMVDYVLSGRQTFVVGPRLQEMFTETSLPAQVEPWMLQAPYPCFYVALPGCEEKIWGEYGAMFPVRGLMIDLEYRPGFMAILLWAPAPVERTIVHHGLDERKLTPEAKNQLRGMGNDSYLIFHIEEAIADPRGLEAYILEQWADGVARAGWSQAAIKDTAKSRFNLLKIVIGTLLYLQSDRKELSADPDAERARADRLDLEERLKRLKTPAKRRKIEEKLKSTAEEPTATWLGRSIEEGPREADEEVDPRAPTTPRRHWVRGHWRRPARKHGPRVLVWVQPFLRGSGEVILGRTYKFKEEEES